MNTINKENYEAYYLDYLEGNLSEDLKSEFKDFMRENPDLDENYKEVELFYLPEPEHIVYSDKKGLLKKMTPTVKQMRTVYWKWGVVAACLLGIIGGVLFIQSNRDLPSFADGVIQIENANEAPPNNEKVLIQKSKYEIANTEPEIANTTVKKQSLNQGSKAQTSPSIPKTTYSKSSISSIAINKATPLENISTTPEILNDPLTETPTNSADATRITFDEVENLATPTRAIAFDRTSEQINYDEIPVVSISESRIRGLFARRYNLEEKGILSDAYAYSVDREGLKETLTPDTYPDAVRTEDIKESLTPDPYSLEINRDELKEAFIPETFVAVFK